MVAKRKILVPAGNSTSYVQRIALKLIFLSATNYLKQRKILNYIFVYINIFVLHSRIFVSKVINFNMSFVQKSEYDGPTENRITFATYMLL